jgi:hypothetical protein
LNAKRAIVWLIVILAILLPGKLKAEESISQKIWNAGAAIVETRTSFGQGYLETDGTSVYLRTIYHVIDDVTDYVWVTIPGLVTELPVDIHAFHCENRVFDHDTGCEFEFAAETSHDILSGVYPVLPYVRVKTNSQMQKDAFVGSPRPDTGKWTIYQIASWNEADITIDAYWYDLNGDGVPDSPAGNFCHGRSGGPLVLWNVTETDMTPVMLGDFPVSLGEMEKGDDADPGHYDYINTSNTCFYRLQVNRPAQ